MAKTNTFSSWKHICNYFIAAEKPFALRPLPKFTETFMKSCMHKNRQLTVLLIGNLIESPTYIRIKMFKTNEVIGSIPDLVMTCNERRLLLQFVSKQNIPEDFILNSRHLLCRSHHVWNQPAGQVMVFLTGIDYFVPEFWQLFPSVIGQAIQDELQVLEKNLQVIILTLGNQSRNQQPWRAL